MRFIAFSASSGALFSYHDFGRRDGGTADKGASTASRLFDMNQLLLQATGTAHDVDNQQSAAPAAAAAGGGRDLGPTILGAGARRLQRSKSSVRTTRLVVRQWNLDTEQWHMAEDPEADLFVALCVNSAWGSDAAASLTRGLSDAFVQANRPQLLALAAAAKAAKATARPSSTGAAALDLAPRRTSFTPTPGGPSALLTLQALKLLCRLGQEGMDALVGAGLQPCWLYLAHAASFMGCWVQTQQRQQDRWGIATGGGGDAEGRSSHSGTGNSAGGSPGGSADDGRGRKSGGLMRGVLGMFRKATMREKQRDGAEGGGSVPQGARGGDNGTRGAVTRAVERGDSNLEPGPVGQLQHLVLPVDGARAPGGGPPWDPTSIAVAVAQVKPLDSQRVSLLARGPGGGMRPDDLREDGPMAFPELEDVELEMEMQLGGRADLARRFLVVGVRLQHVVAVVAHPTSSAGDADGSGVGVGDILAAGSMSQVRHLLRPFLAPASSLFHCLAHWAPQEEVAAHGLLGRLLE